MHLSTPLTDPEYDELDQFLMSDATGDESMDISMLDGFMTAMISGPNVIVPSQWLSKVWGNQEMTWNSAAEAEHMISLLLRHMNTIADVLLNAPDDFEPMTYTREHEGKTVEILDEWCVGFYEGIRLDLEAWKPLMQSDELQEMLFPILLYGTEGGWDQMKANPKLAERHDEFAQMLPRCIVDIYKHWAPHRKSAVQQKTIRHDQPLPGRNDPCPCGSGDKFKKCCGNAAKLH